MWQTATNLITVISYNTDQMSIINLQRPGNIIARKGTKLVGSLTSAVGTFATLAITIKATRNIMPPIFVFSTKKYRECFIVNSLRRCIGLNSHFAWINLLDFNFFEHFVRHTRYTLTRQVLLLIDYHELHLSVKRIEFAKSHGVVILSDSFPTVLTNFSFLTRQLKVHLKNISTILKTLGCVTILKNNG